MLTTLLLCTVLYCLDLQPTAVVRENQHITVEDQAVLCMPEVSIAERVLCNMPHEVGNYDTYETRPKQRPLQVEWGRIGVAGVY